MLGLLKSEAEATAMLRNFGIYWPNHIGLLEICVLNFFFRNKQVLTVYLS